jgi:hypothetical protein
VFRLQNLCGALTDDDAKSHGVAGSYARHDRAIGDTEVFDPIDFKFAISRMSMNPRHRSPEAFPFLAWSWSSLPPTAPGVWDVLVIKMVRESVDSAQSR